jgi:hypothetical protein
VDFEKRGRASFSKIAEKTARSREEYLEAVPPRRGVSAKRHMSDADVWQRTRSLAHVFPPGTRPQLKRRVRLWTLKKEAELLFQKSQKRPQKVGRGIEFFAPLYFYSRFKLTWRYIALHLN